MNGTTKGICAQGAVDLIAARQDVNLSGPKRSYRDLARPKYRADENLGVWSNDICFLLSHSALAMGR